jgi:hypothetical protein
MSEERPLIVGTDAAGSNPNRRFSRGKTWVIIMADRKWEVTMRHFDHRTFATMLCLGALNLGPAYCQSHGTDEKPVHCAQFHINDKASTPIVPGFVAEKTGCQTRKAANGFPLPDPKCAPGAINPTLRESAPRSGLHD